MAAVTTLPAAFVAGNVLTAAQMNDLRGAFRVLQVVSATHATSTSSSSNVYSDTGLTVTITPSSTSSKVLVLVSQNGCVKVSSDTELALRLVRGATELCIFAIQGGITGTSATNGFGSCSHVFLDTPATTSATTYKTQMRSVANSGTVITQANSTQSSICVMEISA
jgi:hypothetical protein